MLKLTILEDDQVILTLSQLCNSGNYLAAYNTKEVVYFYISHSVVALLPRSEWMIEATAVWIISKQDADVQKLFLENALYL